jgi:hypothetical protein
MKQATDADMPEILRRYAAGEALDGGILRDYDVSRHLFYGWLIGGKGDACYRDLVYECLVVRVARARKDLEQAKLRQDDVEIAVAEAMLEMWQMDLDKRRGPLVGHLQ